jgi:hypothetical protein
LAALLLLKFSEKPQIGFTPVPMYLFERVPYGVFGFIAKVTILEAKQICIMS